LLFARAGRPACPTHGDTLSAQTVTEMVDQVLALPEGSKVMLLAPVLVNRKGEHTQLLQELKAQGYIRARINGSICELADAPKLALKQKHTIEVVVDRIKVRPDLQQRLAESFETTLALTEGIAKLAFMDDDKKPELLFSSKYACPHCGYSISELEPRLFSFINPVGACQTCEGLGVETFFDDSKVIANPAMTLNHGAIKVWDERHVYSHPLVAAVSKPYQFDLDTPF